MNNNQRMEVESGTSSVYSNVVPFPKCENPSWSKGGQDYMDDLLKTYIEKVDRDQRDLKADIKESERRTKENIEASEKRSEDRTIRIENIIKESEKRTEDKIIRIENLINEQSKGIESLKDEVRKQLEEDKKYRHTNNIAIVIGVIATALTMIGIYYATVSTIASLITK